MKMLGRLVLVGLLVVVMLLLTTCRPTWPAVPESPKDCLFAIRQGDILLTAPNYSCGDGFVAVINYWWREYDEEGNTEWLRKAEDKYKIYLSIEDGPIEVRTIKDGQIAEIVQMYKGGD